MKIEKDEKQETEKRRFSLRLLLRTICIAFIFLNTYMIVKSQINPAKAPDLFGIRPFVVLTESMNPITKIGDLTIVKETKINKLSKNDIIAFKYNEKIKTIARIVKIEKNKIYVKTNLYESQFDIPIDYIEGRYLFKIPKLGKVVLFFQSISGYVIFFTIIIVLIMMHIYYNNRRMNIEDYNQEKNIMNKKEVKK